MTRVGVWLEVAASPLSGRSRQRSGSRARECTGGVFVALLAVQRR